MFQERLTRARRLLDRGVLPIPRNIAAMEAKLVDALPEGEGWQFEPKWDGFRCIALRDGPDVELRAKSGKTLSRYFPEVTAQLLKCRKRAFAIDGELVIPVGRGLSFDALQMRVHPAESRIRRLSQTTPAGVKDAPGGPW